MRFEHGAAVALLLATLACGRQGESGPAANGADGEAATAPELRPDPPMAAAPDGQWTMSSSSEGSGLAFAASDGARLVHLFCPARSGSLLVNLAAAKPIASEERLSFGGGGEVVALVADPRGDALRGGVSGRGPAPRQLESMLRAGPGASYGAVSVGPLPPVEPGLVGRFAAACRPPPPPASPPRSACRVQDGRPIDVPPIRALGTEPFWNAEIDGRCVTYKTPENLGGTRVWTRWSGSSGGGHSFVGSLGGRPFRLTVRSAPGCSDGMSDNRYPMAASLEVGGERRGGCAEPR